VKALAVLLALCACNTPDRRPKGNVAGATPKSGGTLHIATKDQISSLDPTLVYEEVSTYIMQPLFATLVTYAPASRDPGALPPLTVVPDLAERWEITADGLTYRFYLRDKLAYEDGGPIVAGDFKYSLERALSRADSPYRGFLVDIVGATEVTEATPDCAGIVAVSARELEIRLIHPSSSFLYILAMKFATPQRGSWAKPRLENGQLRREPLASGPFKLGAPWDEGTKIVLVKNEHYWAAASTYLAAIEMRENIPRDTQFLMFERGELDTAEKLSPPDYVWLKGDKDWERYVRQTAQMVVFGARMDTNQEPFTDPRVRRALNYALDKDHTVKLLNGAAVPSHGMLSPGMLGRDATLGAYPHDPEKARALLMQAGYGTRFGFAPLELTYVTQNDEQAETLAGAMQADLAEVGVTLKIELVSFATLSTMTGSSDRPKFSLTSWVGDYPDPTNFLDVRFHSRAIADETATNDTNYSNPEVDALLDAARGEIDTEKRAVMYRRAERIIFHDAPWIFDYHPLTTEVIQPYVGGYEIHPIWGRDYTHTFLDDGTTSTVPP